MVWSDFELLTLKTAFELLPRKSRDLPNGVRFLKLITEARHHSSADKRVCLKICTFQLVWIKTDWNTSWTNIVLDSKGERWQNLNPFFVDRNICDRCLIQFFQRLRWLQAVGIQLLSALPVADLHVEEAPPPAPTPKKMLGKKINAECWKANRHSSGN